MAMASAVDLCESGRTGASHHRVVRVAVLLMVTWSARHKIVASRGKTSSLQRLRFLLALVLVPTLTPAPADLEGRPASTLVLCATPCRSSRVRAGDLQTVQYNAGCKHKQGVRSTSAQRTRQVLGTLSSQKFPAIGHPTRALQSSLQCSAIDSTPSTQFQNNVQHHATPQHSADVRPEPPPLCDGTSPCHSTQYSNTMAHSFQLVFQSRVRSGRARRCVINKRQMALCNSNCNV